MSVRSLQESAPDFFLLSDLLAGVQLQVREQISVEPRTVNLHHHAVHGNFNIEVRHGRHGPPKDDMSVCSGYEVEEQSSGTNALLRVCVAPPEALNSP